MDFVLSMGSEKVDLITYYQFTYLYYANMDVKIIFNGEAFYISRKVLEESDFFRGMLLIENDDLVLNNMDIDISVFRMFVLMIQNVNLVDVVKLYDYFGFEQKYEIIKSYLCMKDDCNKVAFKNKFCVLHKCVFNDCEEEKVNTYDYCVKHKCFVEKCNDIRYEKDMYCVNHGKCHLVGCDNNRMSYYKEEDGLCLPHLRDKINKKMIRGERTWN